MATLFYLITIIISILVHESFQDNATIPAIGTDCLGNDFLCVDQTQFLICVDRGTGFKTADQQTQACGSKSYCDNSLNYECASGEPVTEAPMSTTSAASQTTNSTTVIIDESATLSTLNVTETDSTLIVVQSTGTESTTIPQVSTTVLDESTGSVGANATSQAQSATTTVVVTTPAQVNVSSTTLPNTESGNTTTPSVEGTTAVTEVSGNGHIGGPISPSSWTAGTTTTPAPTTIAPSFVCQRTGSYPHPTDCRKFVFCLAFGRYYHSFNLPCLFNRAFDPERKRCLTDVDRLCKKPKFQCTARGYFKHPNSAVKYFICISIGKGNFRQSELSCPPQFVFNVNIKRCVHNREVHSTESRNSNENR